MEEEVDHVAHELFVGEVLDEFGRDCTGPAQAGGQAGEEFHAGGGFERRTARVC